MELKILITGANGFFGKYLIEKLDSLGIQYLKFTGDLLDINNVESFFKENNIDVVIHLVGTFEEPFEKQMDLNFNTTKNLLEIGRKYGLKKIIYCSTGAVYGEPIKNESFEDDLCKPNTFYGLSKKLTEDLILFYSDNFNINYVILRFPNVYGEGNDKGVIFNFKNSIKNNSEIVIYGDGEQSRNFLHVTDAVEGIYKSIYYENNDIFNISNPIKVSLNQLVEKFSEKYKFKVIHKPANNNLKDLLLNTSKAEKKLHLEIKFKNIII